MKIMAPLLVLLAALLTGCSASSGSSSPGAPATTASPGPTREGAQAVSAYRSWVQAQTDALVPAVDRLLAAVSSENRAQARAAYVTSRVPWERIEPVAESFGDLDPRMDLREADLEPGATWTGWHRIEKTLWSKAAVDAAVPVARQLAADARELRGKVASAQLSPTSIGKGAKELLDEVATGKITGEEETFSHVDLVDFQANLDGARQAYRVLRPMVSDADLRARLDREFPAVQAALDTHRTGGTFVSYATVGAGDRRTLARAVDGLSEPLSRLAAAAQ